MFLRIFFILDFRLSIVDIWVSYLGIIFGFKEFIGKLILDDLML